MGYITINMIQDGEVHQYQFLFGEYMNDNWSAKLFDDYGGLIKKFRSDSLSACFEDLVDTLPKYGLVKSVSAPPAEKNYLCLFENKLRSRILIYRFSYN